MSTEQSADLTEDETKLYDRQIRTWGLDTQRRLRSARVLLVGLKGLGCEVAKNLVLAGIKSLVVLDHHDLAEDDIYAQFLAPWTCIGKNRAISSLERLQALNPRVNVSAENFDIMTKDASFYSNFDVAIITECHDTEAIAKLNNLCREANTLFFAGCVYGFFGYFFEDMGLHCFEHEVKVQEGPFKKGEKNDKIEIIKRRMRFPTFGEVLKFNWLTKKRNLRACNSDPCFFIIMMMFDYFKQCSQRPSGENRDMAMKHLRTARDLVHNNYALPENMIPENALAMLFSEASPVASIIGGSLAQEVIKGITKRGVPLKNFLFYNPLTNEAMVDTIGKTKMTFLSDEGWEPKVLDTQVLGVVSDDEDDFIEFVPFTDHNSNQRLA